MFDQVGKEDKGQAGEHGEREQKRSCKEKEFLMSLLVPLKLR